MLFIWFLIITICALCVNENPVMFGAGFCIGYIIKAISDRVDLVLAEAIHEYLEKLPEKKDGDDE